MSNTETETTLDEMPYAEKAWALREEIQKVLFKEDGTQPSDADLRGIISGLAPILTNCAHRLILNKDGEHPVIPWEHHTQDYGENVPLCCSRFEDPFTIRVVAVDKKPPGGHVEIGLSKLLLQPWAYREESAESDAAV